MLPEGNRAKLGCARGRERRRTTPNHPEPGRARRQRRRVLRGRPRGRRGRRAHTPASVPIPSSALAVSRGGAVAARWAHNPKVAGSNPAPATKPDPVRFRTGSFFISHELSSSGVQVTVRMPKPRSGRSAGPGLQFPEHVWFSSQVLQGATPDGPRFSRTWRVGVWGVPGARRQCRFVRSVWEK